MCTILVHISYLLFEHLRQNCLVANYIVLQSLFVFGSNLVFRSLSRWMTIQIRFILFAKPLDETLNIGRIVVELITYICVCNFKLILIKVYPYCYNAKLRVLIAEPHCRIFTAVHD